MGIAWDDTDLSFGPCGRVRCEPGWRLDAGWSGRLSDCDLWYVWAGRGRMTLRDGRPIDLRRGVCVWMRPGGTYLAEQDPDDRLGVTYIHFELSTRGGEAAAAGPVPWWERVDLPPEIQEAGDAAYFDAVTRRVVELVTGEGSGIGRDAGIAVAGRLMAGVLMELEAAAATPRNVERDGRTVPGRYRRLILDAAASIREDPARSPSVAELADRVGVTPDHFTRLFRETLGVVPLAYIITARIDRARQLLLESSLSVTEIAAALGYSDVYFFSRQFKQRTGTSPARFRVARGGTGVAHGTGTPTS